MKTEDVRSLNAAGEWAASDTAPPEAKILLRELQRRQTAYTGCEGWLYETPPENRLHECVERNMADVVIAWIEYDKDYGFELVDTNVYGDGGIVKINFCPFCGEKLVKPIE